MKYLRILLFFLFPILLTSCYMHSAITPIGSGSDLPTVPSVIFGKITSFENISGSSNYAVTAASGYRVKQSAGMLVNKQLTSTQNGYRVYLHVNGRITSGE